jgi:hypothetical protein
MAEHNADSTPDDVTGPLGGPSLDEAKRRASATGETVPDEAKSDLVDAAVRSAQGAAQREVAEAAVRAAPDEVKKDVIAAALRSAQGAPQKEAAAAAARAVPDDVKEDLVAAAVESTSRRSQTDVANAAVDALSVAGKEELADRLLPGQGVANQIWLIIVGTFAGVLVIATLALVVAVLFKRVDPALVQILLTVLTTVAGILAGFVSGRSSTRGRPSS